VPTAVETIRPASIRLAERFSLGPLALGSSLASLLLVILLGTLTWTGTLGQLISGEVPEWRGQDFRVGVVLCLILAYLPASLLYIVRLAQRSLRELATVLDLQADELEDQIAELECVGRKEYLLAGALGLLSLLVIAFLPEAVVTRDFDLSRLDFLTFSHRVMSAFIGFLSGSGMFVTVRVSRRLAALTAERARTPLLESGRWLPLGKLGLGNAFVSAGMISLLLLLVPDREAGVGMALLLAGLVVGISVLGGLGLVMPLRGVRERIRQAKRREIEACDERITLLRGMWDEPPGSPGESGKLADVIAYRALIDDVSEWPIDLPQLGRFTLVFGLPLASWVAAAFVERLIDIAIG